MAKTIKEAKQSILYKEQKLFVITDVGARFKYRFCVIGLPAGLYNLTRYFKTEAEACTYFEEVWDKNKEYIEEVNRGFEEANHKAKAHGARRMHQLYKRAFRRDCSFKRRKG